MVDWALKTSYLSFSPVSHLPHNTYIIWLSGALLSPSFSWDSLFLPGKNQLQFLRTRLKRPHIPIFITGEICIQFCQGNVLSLLQGSFSEHACNTRAVSLFPQPEGLDTQQITLSAGGGAEGKPCSNCTFDPTASQSTVQCINHLLVSTAVTKLLFWKNVLTVLDLMRPCLIMLNIIILRRHS